MQLLNISQALKNYNHLHEKSPKFGMDILSYKHEQQNIVILQNDGKKKSGTPVRFDFYTMILCFEGGSIRSVNQHDYIIEKKSIQLLPPGVIHSFGDSHEINGYYVLLFNKDFIDIPEVMNFHNENFDNLTLDVNSFNKMKSFYEDIDFELKEKEINYITCVKNILSQMLIFLKRSKQKLQVVAPKSTSDLISEQFLCLIEKNFYEKKSVAEYASLIGLSSKHLSETVKKNLGESALFFIHKRIIKEAKYLLVYSNKNIYNIAILLNFQDASQFTRFFKRKMGIPPKRYRIDFQIT